MLAQDAAYDSGTPPKPSGGLNGSPPAPRISPNVTSITPRTSGIVQTTRRAM